jgi:DNA mismatch endonuclease (patch repair protein)
VRPLAGLRCRADLVFPRKKIAIFVDGCFWHGCPKHGRTPKKNKGYWASKLALNAQRDERNNEALRRAGWAVLRIWEHDDVDLAAKRVVELVRYTS